MPVPFSQTWAVVRHVWRNKLRRVPRYPLVLMLEPLLRCNLACPGCGKIRQGADLLRRQLTPDQCFAAAEECGAPIVSIPGGEPLLHPQIVEIVDGLIARGRFVYLCTNALKLEDMLPAFRPHRRLVLSIHLDGPPHVHDAAVGRAGVYETAVRALRAARARGFRVTTNATLFAGVEAQQMRAHFDRVMELGVEGIMISPGYAYHAAAGQAKFLGRQRTQRLFRELLQHRPRRWRFNQTPLFLAFLQGDYALNCTPWGTPTYNVLGWQRPCYLIQDGHCGTFAELLETTAWERYGSGSGNPSCQDCMVHCGFEPSAVEATVGSLSGLWATLRFALQWPQAPAGRYGSGVEPCDGGDRTNDVVALGGEQSPAPGG